MNIYEFGPIKALITAVSWLVTRLGELLEPFAGSASAALGVIALTVIVRLLLIPVGRSQVRASVARQRIAPQMRELQERHGKNPELLQQKMMELYRAENASPFAGCLPVLLQTPILMAVYGVFILPTVGGEPNELLRHELFGIPLGESFANLIATGAADGTVVAVFLAIMALIAIVAQGSRKLLAPPEAAAAAPQSAPQSAPRSANSTPGEPELPAIPPGLMTGLSFLPFLTAVIAAFVPLAAALYLATTTAWTFAERLILTRIYHGRTERAAA